MHFSLHRPIGFGAPSRLALSLAALGVVALAPSVAQAQTYTPITNFAKNGNSQQVLQKTFPSGSFTANNSFATPFQITADGSGNNFEQINNFGTTLTINVGLFGVSDVYIPSGRKPLCLSIGMQRLRNAASSFLWRDIGGLDSPSRLW